MRLMILLMLSTLAIGGCTTSATDGALRDRDWQLVSTGDFPSIPSGVATPTIRFGSDGRLGGNTGCNSAGAAYTLAGDRLTTEAIIATKRACLNPEGNRLERAYLQAVESARRYRVTNGLLELLDEGGNVVARFR